MAFSLRVSASFRFPLYGMHEVSAAQPIGHESFFQPSINPHIPWYRKSNPVSVGCEPLITVVRSAEAVISMSIIVASLVVNVLVAGFFGLATGFNLDWLLPKLDVVFGPDTPARRVLSCLYLAIAAISAVALVVAPLRMNVVVVLLPLQILYKLLTLFFVADARNPVPWWNLVISVLHGASLWVAFSSATVQ